MLLVASAQAFTLWTCDSDAPATSVTELGTWYLTMPDEAATIQAEVEAWLAALDLSACPVTTCTTCRGSSACTCEEVVCELADGSAVSWRVEWGEGYGGDLEWREERGETWSVQTAGGVSLDSAEEDLSYGAYEQTYTATWTGSLGGSLPDDSSLDWTYYVFETTTGRGHDLSWSVPGCGAEIDTDIVDYSWEHYVVRIGPSTGEVSFDWYDGAACPGPMEYWARLDGTCAGIVASHTDWTVESADADGDCEVSPADCDDTDPALNSCATDDTSDGVDQDCSGHDYLDADGDGEEAEILGGDDCDDGDPSVCDDCPETPYDGVDQDCNGADLVDVDGDGHDAIVAGGDDCDDADAHIHPGAALEADDGDDDDCDGVEEVDADDDGAVSAATGGTDCDDADAEICPSCAETAYDGVDQDCDGADATDLDRDGYEAEEAGGTDCDDGDAEISPGAADIAYDRIDQDCDGADLADVDGDGHDADFAGGDDCHDADASIHPGAPEWAYDGVDQDCNGADLVDADLDGHDGEAAGGDDCDDADHDVSPSAEEIACDGIDQDCDGADLEEACAQGVPPPEAAPPPAPGCTTAQGSGILTVLAGAAALARRAGTRVSRRP